MNVVFLGSPGVGKGIYAQLLTKIYGIPHISTGHLLRLEVEKQSEIGSRVKSIVCSSGLVPDDIVLSVLQARINEGDMLNGFFLDGFPRTIAQAEELKNIVRIDRVINFEASPSVIMERLSGRVTCRECGKIFHSTHGVKQGDSCSDCGGELFQRADDTDDNVRARLKEYDLETRPLISYYESAGILSRIHHDVPLVHSEQEFLAKVASVLGKPEKI